MPQTREEFLAERRTGIGSSDAAALFSIGWGCHRRLVYQKRGTPPDYEDADKYVFRRGNALEPIVAQEYANDTGRALSTTAVIRHPDFPFLLVHADRLILQSEEHGDEPGILEIKTSGREVFRKLEQSGMADEHTLQVQWALMVSQLSWGSYVNLHPDSFNRIWFDIEPDQEVIAELVAQGVETWTMVENGPLPERLEPDDRRCFKCEFSRSCQGEALLEAVGDAARRGNFDQSVQPALEAYLSATEVVKQAEEVVDDAREALEMMMQNRPLVRTGVGYVTWNPHERTTVDSAKLKRKYPQIYKELAKKSVVRPLRVFFDNKDTLGGMVAD